MTVNKQVYKSANFKLGFTMIELLVVISIIGVLATLVMVSFTGSQKQAKDSQRKSDIRQYSTALEAYANKNNGLYPARSDANGAVASTTLCNDLGINTCPEDPKNINDSGYPAYKYQSDGGVSDGSATSTVYVLWAKLENTDNYWVVCSTGKVGPKATFIWNDPVAGVCPI